MVVQSLLLMGLMLIERVVVQTPLTVPFLLAVVISKKDWRWVGWWILAMGMVVDLVMLNKLGLSSLVMLGFLGAVNWVDGDRGKGAKMVVLVVMTLVLYRAVHSLGLGVFELAADMVLVGLWYWLIRYGNGGL